MGGEDMMTVGAALLLLVFGMVLAYAAGRADLRDMGPLRRKGTRGYIASAELVPMLQRSARRRENLARLRAVQSGDDGEAA